MLVAECQSAQPKNRSSKAPPWRIECAHAFEALWLGTIARKLGGPWVAMASWVKLAYDVPPRPHLAVRPFLLVYPGQRVGTVLGLAGQKFEPALRGKSAPDVLHDRGVAAPGEPLVISPPVLDRRLSYGVRWNTVGNGPLIATPSRAGRNISVASSTPSRMGTITPRVSAISNSGTDTDRCPTVPSSSGTRVMIFLSS